jgi:hypothetical protein
MHTSAKACPTAREIPGRSNAEEALAAALTGGRPLFVQAILLVPDHLISLTDSGDYETSDRALVASCQEFIRAVPPGSRVYRWSATSLVALTGSAESVTPERCSGLGTVGLFELVDARSPEHLTREMDLFVAQHVM